SPFSERHFPSGKWPDESAVSELNRKLVQMNTRCELRSYGGSVRTAYKIEKGVMYLAHGLKLNAYLESQTDSGANLYCGDQSIGVGVMVKQTVKSAEIPSDNFSDCGLGTALLLKYYKLEGLNEMKSLFKEELV